MLLRLGALIIISNTSQKTHMQASRKLSERDKPFAVPFLNNMSHTKRQRNCCKDYNFLLLNNQSFP